MLSYQLIVALLAASSVNALPLNINLGAYSPALVVGDGEISFGGAAVGANGVSGLMTALQGASTSGTTTAAAATGGEAAAAAPAAAAGTAAAAKGTAVTTSTTTFTPIATPIASAAAVEAAAVELPQGMGKAMVVGGNEIAPRVADTPSAVKRDIEADVEVDAEVEAEQDAADVAVEKRDIAGFNAALAYSTAALKTSPEVQLGTGAEGSGVGILQKAGGVTTAAKAA